MRREWKQKQICLTAVVDTRRRPSNVRRDLYYLYCSINVRRRFVGTDVATYVSIGTKEEQNVTLARTRRSGTP